MKKKFGGKGIVTIMALALLLLFGCAGMVPNVPDIPESTGIVYMDTWEELKAQFNQEAAMPNLSETYKDVLRQKREALKGLYYGALMHGEYTELGYLTAETLDRVFAEYINIAEIPFGDIVSIYWRYKNTGELDVTAFEAALDMAIAYVQGIYPRAIAPFVRQSDNEDVYL